jgi:uncharacterized coiled-coil protein SlyX
VFTKTNSNTPGDVIIPLRRGPSTATPPATRKEQLRRQRARIQEYLETIEVLTQERDEARELADRMLSTAEVAQNRVLQLETQLAVQTALVADLSAENDALLQQGMAQAEQLDLLENRLRVYLAD